MTAFVTDTFTGSAGTTLQTHTGELGATWTKHPAAAQDMVLTNANKLRGSSTGNYGLYYASAVPPSSEYAVSCTVTQVSLLSNPTGICARLDTAAQTCYYAQYGGSGALGLFELRKVVAGVETSLGQYVQTLGDGNSVTMTLQVYDRAKKLLINGITRVTSSDNTITATGRVGVKGKSQNNNTTGTHIDDLSADPVAPLPPIGTFTNLHRSLVAQGGITKQGVYRGLTDGSEKFYVAHTYHLQTGDLVATDPSDWSSIVYPFPLSGEDGAWAMAYHPVEKNLYLGTFFSANVFRFNTTTQAFTDLGPVGGGAQYVWDMNYSPFNQKIYGGCSDGTYLIRMDGSTITNIGQVDNTSGNSYARWVCCDPNPAQPYVYIGVGVNRALLFSYNINTGVFTQLADGGSTGSFTVDRQEDGTVYANYGSQHYFCSAGGISATSSHPYFDDNKFANGDAIDVSTGTIVITLNGGGTATHPYNYAGKALQMWRLGADNTGKIYGGGALPDWLGRLYDIHNSGTPSSVLGYLGGGQAYYFLVRGTDLWISQYGGSSTWMRFDPTQPVSPQPWVPSGGSNPRGITGGADWRPNIMVNGPDGYIYTGTPGGYGQLDGRVVRIDPVALTTSVIIPYSDQGLDSLLITPSPALGIAGSWALLGSTTTLGGGGAIPTATTVEAFTIEPATFTVVNKTPYPVTADVSQLVANATTCYMLATDQSLLTSYIAVYNHANDTFGAATSLPFSNLIYNSCVIFQNAIVGLCDSGVFTIPLSDFTQAWVAGFPPYPTDIIETGSFFNTATATWYFAGLTELWSYQMPGFSPDSGQDFYLPRGVRTGRIYRT